jgi:Flp pilus assembly protein TadD
MGIALFAKGSKEEALAQYHRAIELDPHYAKAHYNLGNALLQMDKPEDAIAQYRLALETTPDDSIILNNLGIALAAKNDDNGAIAQFRKALEFNPDSVNARFDLGVSLVKIGKVDEAVAQYRKVLEVNPNYVKAQKDLAWILATASDASLRNGANAVALAEQANQLTGGGNAIVLRTLAAAYAEAGRFGDAAATAQRAIELAAAQKNDDLTGKLPKEIKLYESGAPMRDGPQ